MNVTRQTSETKIKLILFSNQKCIEGCVEETVKCETDLLWRDERTCVPVKDCTCYSNDGNIVKVLGTNNQFHGYHSVRRNNERRMIKLSVICRDKRIQSK